MAPNPLNLEDAEGTAESKSPSLQEGSTGAGSDPESFLSRGEIFGPLTELAEKCMVVEGTPAETATGSHTSSASASASGSQTDLATVTPAETATSSHTPSRRHDLPENIEAAAAFGAQVFSGTDSLKRDATTTVDAFIQTIGSPSNVESFKLFVLERILHHLPQNAALSSQSVSLWLQFSQLTLYDLYTLDHASTEQLTGHGGNCKVSMGGFVTMIDESLWNSMKDLDSVGAAHDHVFRLLNSTWVPKKVKQRACFGLKRRMGRYLTNQNRADLLRVEEIVEPESTEALLLKWSVGAMCAPDVLRALVFAEPSDPVRSTLPCVAAPHAMLGHLSRWLLEGTMVRGLMAELLEEEQTTPVDPAALIPIARDFLQAIQLVNLVGVIVDGFTLDNGVVLLNLAACSAADVPTSAESLEEAGAVAANEEAAAPSPSAEGLTLSQMARFCAVALHEFAHFARLQSLGEMTDTPLKFPLEGEAGFALEKALNHGNPICLRTPAEEAQLLCWDGCAPWPLSQEVGPSTVKRVQFRT
jgi:hypothetical protein